MRKAILILLAGLLWCSVGVAEVIELECKQIGDNAEKNNKIYEERSFLIEMQKNLVTRTLVRTDEYLKEKKDKGFDFFKKIQTEKYKIIARSKDYIQTEWFTTTGMMLFRRTINFKKNSMKVEIKIPEWKDYKKFMNDKEYWKKSYDSPMNGSETFFECIRSDKTDIAEKPKKPKSDDKKIVAAASGTGFFVSSSGHIVTNHHVIEKCNQVKVHFKGSEIEAKILAVDKTNDLAIIKVNINPDKVYAVSNKDVSLLQDVIVAGFPLGKDISSAIKTHKGSVTALAGFGDNYSNFETDATINQGNSGGPIIDKKGNIVGVAVATWVEEGVQNIHFGIKSSTLKTFASANEIDFLPPSNQEMLNEDLGQLITKATIFLECWMSIAKIKQMIAEEKSRKAFYSEHK